MNILEQYIYMYVIRNKSMLSPYENEGMQGIPGIAAFLEFDNTGSVVTFPAKLKKQVAHARDNVGYW